MDNTIKDNNGWSAVHHAASRGHLEILRILSADRACWKDKVRTCHHHNGIRLSESEMLLTHLAALKGHKECLEYLLTFPECFSLQDKAGSQRSLLLFATYSRTIDVVDYLLKNGAKCTTPADGTTPLHIAVEADEPRIVNMLMKYGHDPYAVDQRGLTALSIARMDRDSIMMSALWQSYGQPG